MKIEMVGSNVDSLYSKTFWAMFITLMRQELRRQMLRYHYIKHNKAF